MKTEERICAVCGNEFIATRPNAKYCSEECKEEGRRRLCKKNDKAKRERKREERKERADDRKKLDSIEVAAKKAGMSYGLYVALMRV